MGVGGAGWGVGGGKEGTMSNVRGKRGKCWTLKWTIKFNPAASTWVLRFPLSPSSVLSIDQKREEREEMEERE